MNRIGRQSVWNIHNRSNHLREPIDVWHRPTNICVHFGFFFSFIWQQILSFFLSFLSFFMDAISLISLEMGQTKKKKICWKFDMRNESTECGWPMWFCWPYNVHLTISVTLPRRLHDTFVVILFVHCTLDRWLRLVFCLNSTQIFFSWSEGGYISLVYKILWDKEIRFPLDQSEMVWIVAPFLSVSLSYTQNSLSLSISVYLHVLLVARSVGHSLKLYFFHMMWTRNGINITTNVLPLITLLRLHL